METDLESTGNQTVLVLRKPSTKAGNVMFIVQALSTTGTPIGTQPGRPCMVDSRACARSRAAGNSPSVVDDEVWTDIEARSFLGLSINSHMWLCCAADSRELEHLEDNKLRPFTTGGKNTNSLCVNPGDFPCCYSSFCATLSWSCEILGLGRNATRCNFVRPLLLHSTHNQLRTA